MPSLIEIGLLVLEEKIFKDFQCIFTLLLLFPDREGYPLRLKNLNLPLEEELALCLKKLEFPSLKDNVYQV